jgi:ketosteroid isomerase-like protein
MSSVPDRLVEALRTFDVDALSELLAPDGTRWLNVGDSTRTAAEVLEITRVERTLVASATLEVRQQSATEDGFVLQLVFAGTTRGGAEFRMPICLVARVADGRITHYDEYADESSLAPLREEFFASQAG